MRRIILLMMCVVLSFSVNAKVVDRTTAKEKAMRFMPGKRFVENKTFASARGQEPTRSDAFYVFNAEDNQGYVIISGDDRTQEVLGYAEHGNLDERNMPENMKWWLGNLAQQIMALDTSLKPAARNVTRATMSPISPLIKTEWGQDAPYNYMCPDGNYVDYDETGYKTNNRCITGCVATAMAQVMYYWQWPNGCDGIEEYSMGHWDNKGTDENPDWQFTEVCKVHALPATTFDWDKMKLKYKGNEKDESADAVANLMRYCGQAAQMEYGTNVSLAHLGASPMAQYFNYSKNIKELSRDNYTSAQWENMVYQELAEGRPVLYSGQSTRNGGHQFIVDGYRSDGLYHMNWGWSYDGSYSVLSVADPEKEQSMGGTQNEVAFQYYQAALFGVKPAEEGEVMHPILYSYLDEFTAADYTRTNANADFKNVYLNSRVSGEYNIEPTIELVFEIGWGLYQDDQFVSCVTSEKIKLPLYRNFYTDYKATVSFGANLPDGKYMLNMIYRYGDNEEWTRCEDYGIYSLVADVSATNMTVRKQQMTAEVNDLSIPKQPMVGNPMDVVINVTNTGEMPTVILKLMALQTGASDWEKLAEEEFFVNPGATEDVHLLITPQTIGDFTWVIAGASDEELYNASISINPSDVAIPSFCTYEEGEICAFFEAPAAWGNTIHCWAWIDEPAENFTGGTWPGVACEYVGTADNGNKVWKWSWNGWKQNNTDATQPEKIIFNNDGQPQTNDLLFVLHGYYNENGVQGEVVTGIRGISVANATDGKVYSLDGRLLRNDGTTDRLAKGIYIVNGQKIIIR